MERQKQRARGSWITRDEAARRLGGVRPQWVSKLISSGKVAVRRLGRSVEVDSADVADLVAEQRRRPGAYRIAGKRGSLTADRLEAARRRVAKRLGRDVAVEAVRRALLEGVGRYVPDGTDEPEAYQDWLDRATVEDLEELAALNIGAAEETEEAGPAKGRVWWEREHDGQ